MKIHEKKARADLAEEIIFIILNVVFIFMLIFFVLRMSNSTAITEEIYAKKIALTIDSMMPGTEVNISLSKVIESAKRNKYSGNIIEPGDFTNNNLITIKAVDGGGYSFYYFSALNDLSFSLNLKEGVLTIKS